VHADVQSFLCLHSNQLQVCYCMCQLLTRMVLLLLF
jgi:hypothetical protein